MEQQAQLKSTTHPAANRSARIRTLNDALRQGRGGGRIMLTAGVAALDRTAQIALLKAVQRFDAFDKGNDPHAEHDFGSVAIADESFFWKIDYYDTSSKAGSPDPADPAVTCRVLTIMRADEY